MDAFEFPSFFSGIAKTLRILMLCLALSWILSRLPSALRFSAECLRSPLFVFALSNVIIAALIAQSGRADSVSPPPEEVLEYHDKHITDDDSDPDSERLKDGNETQGGKLQRSETEILYPHHDELSNEEFQRTIEAFIAKQMRFLREESLAILVHPAAESTNHRPGAKSLNIYTNCSC